MGFVLLAVLVIAVAVVLILFMGKKQKALMQKSSQPASPAGGQPMQQQSTPQQPASPAGGHSQNTPQ